jgi:hypothetical protein
MDQQTINTTILPALINGETGSSIADKVGCHESTISRLKTKLSGKLEEFQLQLINEAGQETVDNITATIGRANKVLSDDKIKSIDLGAYKDLLTLSHKKEVLVGQSLGILPTQSQSLQITNILNISTGPRPEDIQRIQELLVARQEADIQEAEVIEDEAA